MRLYFIATFMVLAGVSAASAALDPEKAEKLFMEHCAVCHGADRGGYIGPALNRDETEPASCARSPRGANRIWGQGSGALERPPARHRYQYR